MIGCSVTHEAKACAGFLIELEGIGYAQTQWGLPADDTVPSPKVLVGSEKVHGTTLAFGATGFLAVKFGHALIHVHAYGKSVSMVPVGGNDVVIFGHGGNGANGNSLLAYVKVQEPADVPLLIGPQGAFLEPPDPNHLLV